MRTLIIGLLLVIFTGCDKTVPDRRGFDDPPSGQGHYLDEEGVDRSVFKVLGSLTYGDARDLSIERDTLVGYTFFGSAGDAPLVQLSSDSDATYSLAIYGPRSNQGLWGNYLVERHGKRTLTLSDFSLRTDGVYFVLVRIFGKASGEIELSLNCESCAEPSCSELIACDLFCPNGQLSDENGCPLCACSGANCAVTGCVAGERCVFPCDRTLCAVGQTCQGGRCVDGSCPVSCDLGDVCIDGQCVQRPFHCAPGQRLCQDACDDPEVPVCGIVDGNSRSFPSRCRAECAGATEIMDGPCRDQCSMQNPCPDEQRCQAGRCISDRCAQCPAPSRVTAVCGTDGRTYGNLCLLECAPSEPDLAYSSGCVSQCQSNNDCGFGASCIPLPPSQIPENREACSQNLRSEECIRTCRELDVCSSVDPECRSGPVPDRMHSDGSDRSVSCYPMNQRRGLCLMECNPADEGQCGDFACARVDAWREDSEEPVTLCMPACETDADCPGQLLCRPDYAGTRVCQSCVCSSFADRPLCSDGEVFPNPCQLLCSGRTLESASRIMERETCDGLDNDCDGAVDEDIGPRACGDDACESQQRCVDGEWTDCEPRPAQAIEMCDGLDNDCDGRTDERLVRRCGSDEGICRPGQQMCQRGQWTECRGATEPRPEICGDGIDQDCNGQDLRCEARDVDGDGFSVEQGDCNDEDPLVNPRQRESCDGVDQDCDGSIDEDTRRTDEVCDGLDNDCDGQVDEGDRDVFVGCVGEDGENPCIGAALTRSLVRICGTNEGVCDRGHEVCQAGRWSNCIGARAPMDEVCDELDNDCDGVVDENPRDDEVMPPDAQANVCRQDCAQCPVEWNPVCGRDGRLYASACYAQCTTGRRSVPLSDCANLMDADFACEADDECRRLGQRNGLCVGQDVMNDRIPELDPVAQCIASTSECGCVDNRCTFRFNADENRCGAGIGRD